MATNKQPLLSDDIMKKIGHQLRHHFEADQPTSMSAAMADAIKRLVAKGEQKTQQAPQ